MNLDALFFNNHLTKGDGAMKKTGLSIICILVAFTFLPGIVAAKDKVIIYTSLENEEVVDYLKFAKQELPGLDINAIRLSTGELGARMLAERENPQADLIWGWAVTNMSEFVPKGMLTPYKPKGWDKIPTNFKDPDGYWTAIDLYAAALVPNPWASADFSPSVLLCWGQRRRHINRWPSSIRQDL